MRNRAGRLAVLAAALLLFPAGAAPRATALDTPAGLKEAYAEARGRVVGITYTLRQMELETGVEGPKADGVVCGIVVDATGLVVIPGDIYPEPGGDPRTTLAPTEFKVHFDNDVIVPAAPVGIDRRLNLAYVRVDPAQAPSLRPAAFHEAPALQVGDPVVIIGVLGRKYGFAPAFFRATVNAAIPGPVPLLGVDAILQDLAVGGLVLRRDGSAAGIVAKDVIVEDLDGARSPGNLLSILANMGQPQIRRPGYAMVLPYPTFAASVAAPPPLDLEPDRRRAWIGIVMQALGDDLREYWKLDVPGGIIIGSVVEGSPAQAAGLRAGDVLTSFGGLPVRVTEDGQLADFRRKVETLEAGSEIPIEVWRGGSTVRVALRLGEAPKTASRAEEYEDEDFGMTVREITIDVQQALNLDRDFEGVYVGDTEDSGWADVAGLSPQDVILSINGVRVKSVEDVRGAFADVKHRRDPEAIFFVMRQPDTLFVRVKTDFGPRRDGSPAER